MMNQHMPAGSGHHMNPSAPIHQHQSQRQRDYHAYHGPPQAPMHPYQYPGWQQHAPPYHYQPQMQPYNQQQRWQQQPHTPYPQHYMAPQHPSVQHVPYNPRQSTHNGQHMNSAMRPPYANQAYYRHQHQAPLSPNPHMPAMPPQYPVPVTSEADRQTSVVANVSNVSQAMADQEHGQVQPQDPTSQETGPMSGSSIEESDVAQTQSPVERRTPFYPKLPRYYPEDSASTFPPRAIVRKKKRSVPISASGRVALPPRDDAAATSSPALSSTPDANEPLKMSEDVTSEVSTLAAPSESETPATSHAPSESEYNVPTPATSIQAQDASKSSTTQVTPTRRDTRSAVAIPQIPGLSKNRATPPSQDSKVHLASPPTEIAASQDESADAAVQGASPSPAPMIPRSWADLVRTKDNKTGLSQSGMITNGASPTSRNTTMADTLKQYAVATSPLSFIVPRGLVNTGNMCYMNSILQVLVFCVPFYNFLDQVRTRTVHSIKSETPLLDAMIMFMRELNVIASAPNVQALRKVLKPDQLEQYGEPITPEYIYDAIKHLPRFQSMRRGHQQDAEEFLGFVLEGLHDECLAVMQSESATADKDSEKAQSEAGQEADGWLEVGPKQKPAITRTAGQQDAPSPVTKIFGGHLRSELRVPGQKDSVTLEPYKPLQLDIGTTHINNIVDAIKGLTRIENLTGDFGGRGNSAKKQVFIDSLPPVLILHLKRFQYENNLTGTQKIWKKVGYPLELELPKEVFPPSKRAGLAVGGSLPKYRLTSVVYHHGKSAAGGHYTVDVLRQDLREWVRIDDTYIRRIRPEDVAEGGAEEDPKVLAKALEQHKAAQDLQKQRNMYEGLDDDEQVEEPSGPWSEVNGAEKKSKVNGLAAGNATPASTAGKRTPTARREGVKDNKVAYILLYERINS